MFQKYLRSIDRSTATPIPGIYILFLMEQELVRRCSDILNLESCVCQEITVCVLISPAIHSRRSIDASTSSNSFYRNHFKDNTYRPNVL